MRTFILLSLISFNALAVQWTELVQGSDYKLTQPMTLGQLERSRSALEISSGDPVTLKEINPLDAISVMVYVFDYKNCPGPELTTDMEIVPVQGTSPVVEIGAQLETNCELRVYIESKDLLSTSLFE